MLISLASPPHDKWCGQEHEGWEGKGQPETHVLLGVDHTNLANKSSNVDKEVEVVVNSALSDGWVDDNALSGWERLHDGMIEGNLFNNQRRNVWFEATRSGPHDDHAQHEDSEAGSLIGDDWRDSRDDEDDVANDGNAYGDTDRLVSTPVLVCHVGTEKRHAVYPEGVECVDAISGLGALTQCARDTLVAASTGTSIMVRARRTQRLGKRKGVVDKVGI